MKVSYAESSELVANRVGEALQKFFQEQEISRSLILTSSVGGWPYGSCSTDSYGFLLNKKKRLADLFSNKYLVGVLWFRNEHRNASHKKWVLEVYGREYVEFFKKTAEQLAERFNVDIHVRLRHEVPQPRGEWWQG